MIEVIGRDGRVHNFADGTSQAQIDAAMAAIYDTPLQMEGLSAPPPHYREPQAREASVAAGSNKLLLASAVAAGVVSLIAIAYFLGRGGPAPAPAIDSAVQGGAPAAVVASTDPNAGLTATPGTPAITAEAFAGFVATTQGGNLTVRTQPQTIATQLAKLPHGAPLSVTGSVMMSDGLWRQVSVGGATGYVKGEYVSQTQPAAIVKEPAAPTAKMIPREFWAFASTKNMSGVNVRSSPSPSATVISSIPTGNSVYVIGEQGGWYLVEWKGKRGWASTSYISMDSGE